MKKEIYFAFLALAAIASLYIFLRTPSEITNYPPKNDTIVAFGDSLIEGRGATPGNDFISKLGEKIGRPIINMGISGDTTAMGLSRIDEVIARDPGIAIVLFGGNDYLRNVPEVETFMNLRRIIMKLQSSGSMVVLVGIPGGLIRDQYRSNLEKLQKEMGVIYVPNILSGILANGRYMSDAVHPNDAGYKKIAEKVYAAMKEYAM